MKRYSENMWQIFSKTLIMNISWRYSFYDSQRIKLIKNLGKYKLSLPLKIDNNC